MVEFIATLLSLGFTVFLGYGLYSIFKKENKKQHLKRAGIGALLTFLGFAFLSPFLPDESNSSNPTESTQAHANNDLSKNDEKTAIKSDLGIRTDLFDARFNEFTKTVNIDFNIRTHSAKYTQGGIYQTETASEILRDNLGLSMHRRIENKKVVSIVLIYQPNGDDTSIIEMMMAAAGMISGLQPHLSADERGDVAAIITEAVQTKETRSVTKEQIVYTANFSPTIGLLLSAESED